MKFSVAAATLVSLLPAVLGLVIDTPTNVVQCQPVLLNWREGVAPYYLSGVPANQPAATPIKTFPTQDGTSLTWIVDLQANTNFNLALKDSTGLTAYTDIITVQASGNSTCLTNGSGNVSSPPSTNTGSGSPSGSSPASGGSGTSTRTSSTSTPTSGGSTTGGATGLALSSFGVAGVIGAVAALF